VQPCSPPSPASAPARPCPAAPCPLPAAPPWLLAHGPRSSALPAPRMGTGKTNVLPALSWTPPHVFPRDGRDLPPLSSSCVPVWGAEQHHQVLKQCPHPPTLGEQSWDCTDTHTHSFPRKDGAPHHLTQPKICSRHSTFSPVEIPSLNGYLPPW